MNKPTILSGVTSGTGSGKTTISKKLPLLLFRQNLILYSQGDKNDLDSP